MQHSASVFLSGEQDTLRLGKRLASIFRAGDTVLLEGPIGAGKTALARAVIQARLSASGRLEDVPSPTYTLVQSYDDGRTEIWHADLYRLTNAEELVELGLEDAFQNAIVFVEWPDRLGELCPAQSLLIKMEPENEGRRLTFTAGSDRWSDLIESLSSE